MTEEHALLSASSAERWLSCTPSAVLERDAHNDAEDCSVYAKEGTLAHYLAETLLSQLYGKISMDECHCRLVDIEKDTLYTDEMYEHVRNHVDYVKSVTDSLPEYEIMFETRVDYSNIAPEGYGTADVLIVSGKDIYVIDLKYGKGVPVSAKKNPQLRLYGIGALNLYPSAEVVHMTINQPRIGNLDETSETKTELLAWAVNEVIPKASLAVKGEGSLVPSDKACRFCTLRDRCKARADQKEGIIKKDFYIEESRPKDVTTLTTDQIAFVLKVGQSVIDWIKEVQSFALGQMDAGVKIQGYKLVEGRSSRVITDKEEVLKRLVDAGIDENQLKTKPELLSLTNLEKIVGKGKFNLLCGDLIDKPKGKLTIVSEDDERPEANTVMLDFKN